MIVYQNGSSSFQVNLLFIICTQS